MYAETKDFVKTHPLDKSDLVEAEGAVIEEGAFD
jgi:hypothetical protein